MGTPTTSGDASRPVQYFAGSWRPAEKRMPLTYRALGRSGTQIAVYCHELRIARIGKRVLSPLAGAAIQWQWAFSLGNAVPEGFQHSGHVETLEDAKAVVERNWQLWRAAAGLKE